MQYELLHRVYVGTKYCIEFMFDAIRTIASTLCLMQFELLHQHEVGCNTNYYIDMRLDARGSIASPFWFAAIRTIAST